MGNLRAAMDGYMRVLKDDPQNADALYYVAVVAVQEGQYPDGIKLAQRALSVGPAQPRLHNLLGQTYVRLGEEQEALASFDRAIELQPDFADAHGNRANVLVNLRRFDDALAAYNRAIELRPDSFEDWINRGALLQDFDLYEEALTSYERAIALRPENPAGHFNLANVLRDLGQIEDARASRNRKPPETGSFDLAIAGYDKAIALDGKFFDAYLGRALVRLLRGNWDAGFHDFEYRSKVGKPTYVPLPQKRWNGEQLPGERLVLVAEQGLGDTINFARFGALLAARGYDVTILVRPAMRALLSTIKGVTIATSHEELAKDPRPLRWLPLMSVAGQLGIAPTTTPADVPYLTATPERVATWAERLGQDGFKIGINWVSGHSENLHFLKRNIPLADFAPLAALPGVKLFSLQKGPAAAQIAEVPFRDQITTLDTDPNPDADLFLDTAAVMTQLDLIITCDTSVAHLAGALARPVFTALPMIADWRWLLSRDLTPWYPTMRLFRQSAPRDWTDTMARITEAVRAMM
jgi:cytochrome c-type biogenesis protein CcmH/NrfG